MSYGESSLARARELFYLSKPSPDDPPVVWRALERLTYATEACLLVDPEIHGDDGSLLLGMAACEAARCAEQAQLPVEHVAMWYQSAEAIFPLNPEGYRERAKTYYAESQWRFKLFLQDPEDDRLSHDVRVTLKAAEASSQDAQTYYEKYWDLLGVVLMGGRAVFEATAGRPVSAGLATIYGLSRAITAKNGTLGTEEAKEAHELVQQHKNLYNWAALYLANKPRVLRRAIDILNKHIAAWDPTT